MPILLSFMHIPLKALGKVLYAFYAHDSILPTHPDTDITVLRQTMKTKVTCLYEAQKTLSSLLTSCTV